MPLAFANISKALPMDNKGGTGDHFLIALRSDLTALPAPLDTDLTTAGTIPAASITLAVGKSWSRVECTLDKGSITSESIGARDHNSFRNTATVIIAANNPQKVGLANYASNKDVIVLVPERNTGLYRVFGTLTDPAHVKPASGTGEGPEGANESRFVIESIGLMAPYVSGPVTIGG